MTETRLGFKGQLNSYPATFWVANIMEIFERIAWYGFWAVAALYMTAPIETGGLGFSSVQRGQIQAIVPFFLYLFPVVTGALADRYGYKKMFIISYLAMMVTYYALGQVTSMPTFMTVFLLLAVAAAIFKPLVIGTVARVTDERNSSTGFGIFYMMVNIGGFLGPIVAGALRGLSWNYVFILCTAAATVNLVIVLLFYKEPTTEAGSARARSLRKVADDAVEVLGNSRFFLTVFVVLVALMLPGFRWAWFTWTHCCIFIAAWVVLNFVWDALLPAGSGRPDFNGGNRRPPLLKRMHCSNWRFALFLLIMSGFWTSFDQLFLAMPEYIRDYSDTRGMVNLGRRVFNAAGHPHWIDRLANIEEPELLADFDRLVRRARGMTPITEPAKPGSHSNGDEPARTTSGKPQSPSNSRGLTSDDVNRLRQMVSEMNTPSATHPLSSADIVDAARRFLQYKVRIQPTELADLIVSLPQTPPVLNDADLASAVEATNKRLLSLGKPAFQGDEVEELRVLLRNLFSSTRFPASSSVQTACAELSTEKRRLEPSILAIGLRKLAYLDHVWDRIDAGRQANPEYVMNVDSLTIVLFQVLVSYLMSRFHRITTMITGMVVATAGIGLWALAGGTMIGPVGGSVLLVIFGIVTFSVGEMMTSPTSQEYVSRIAPRDQSALYMGYYFITVALGSLFAGILSGELYELFGKELQRPDLLWLVFAGIMFLTAIVFLLYNKFALPAPSATAAKSGQTEG